MSVKGLSILHNLFLVSLSAYMCITILSEAWKQGYSLFTNPEVRSEEGWQEPTPTLTELKEMTILDGPAVEKIMDGFLSAFNNGLTTNHFTMIPSYVSRLPTGIEVGTYLALELSDTYLRAAVVTLIGLGKTDIEHKQHEIPAELKNGNVGDLFDWVALNVKELLNDVGYELETKDLYAGINFGFPI
ncbi:2795_t:CDS:2, partial [Entrophospora sp. SA101]